MLTAETVPATGTCLTDSHLRLDLAGPWRLVLDPSDVGERELWFRELPEGQESDVTLPGSVQEQGFGDEISVDTPWTGLVVDRSFYTEERYAPYRAPGAVSVPFWLQPRRYYRGAAWFQREIEVPDSWQGRSIVMELERVHWESTLWVDENRVGSEYSLTTPHRFDLGQLSPGRHQITLRVDNRTIVDVGPNAHSISDHTQGNWNGVIGALTLTALPQVRIAHVMTLPDVARGTIRVGVDLAGGTCGIGQGTVTVRAQRIGGGEVVEASAEVDSPVDRDLSERGMTASGGHVDVEVVLGPAARTWDEFSPTLYQLQIALRTSVGAQTHTDSRTMRIGLREVGTEGTQITVNGRPTFIRGTLESCVHPLTGYPPTDVASWRRIIQVCRAHGLNLLRFHSWCPPEAAFAAADEEGFYFQVEGPVWANQGAGVGESGPVDEYVYAETRRILRTFGHHPSFLLMAHGNEPGGRDAEFLGPWVEHARRLDPRHLYTSGAGWPELAENDFQNIPEPRLQRWGEELSSRINGLAPETESDYRDCVQARQQPIISHEIGQWCAYPNLAEVGKYTGLMQARNFGIFADFLAQAGLADRAQEFLHASGKLQTLCYKEDIEAALRTPGFGGFQLLGLNDFPGQGTAIVGVLDAFWEEKGYCTAAEFARFCGPTVPLARLPKRVWTTEETLACTVQIAHFGPQPFVADITWTLRDDDGVTHASGVLESREVAVGNADLHGQITAPLTSADAPARLTLEIGVITPDGVTHANDWSVWVYPTDTVPQPRVLVVDDAEEAISAAAAGRTVLLQPHLGRPHTDVGLGFSAVFWNTAWTRNQAPHTLGITHDPAHPALSTFPSEGHTDWQWWELIHGGHAMVLDDLPQVRPIISAIDTWFSARRLGLLWEVRVGQGRLLVCSLDLRSNLEQRPVARQLLNALSAYMEGPGEPTPQVSESDLRALFHDSP